MSPQQKPEIFTTPSRSVQRLARRIGLAAMCGALLTGSAHPPSAASQHTNDPLVAAPAAPTLDWQPCDNGFFCATATVPLNYTHPTDATIHLAVIKHPATDPAQLQPRHLDRAQSQPRATRIRIA